MTKVMHALFESSFRMKFDISERRIYFKVSQLIADVWTTHALLRIRTTKTLNNGLCTIKNCTYIIRSTKFINCLSEFFKDSQISFEFYSDSYCHVIFYIRKYFMWLHYSLPTIYKICINSCFCALCTWHKQKNYKRAEWHT